MNRPSLEKLSMAFQSATQVAAAGSGWLTRTFRSAITDPAILFASSEVLLASLETDPLITTLNCAALTAAVAGKAYLARTGRPVSVGYYALCGVAAFTGVNALYQGLQSMGPGTLFTVATGEARDVLKETVAWGLIAVGYLVFDPYSQRSVSRSLEAQAWREQHQASLPPPAKPKPG